MRPQPNIRRASSSDAATLLDLIDALADYERLARPDAEAKARLLSDGLSENARFDPYLLEIDGEAVGYAIVFEAYSSFLARPTLYLEDIFVLPQHRGTGLGEMFVRYLAAEALRRGCGRMEWMVLTWNETAIRFYEKLSARRLAEWATYRFSEADLRRLAADAPEAGATGGGPAPAG